MTLNDMPSAGTVLKWRYALQDNKQVLQDLIESIIYQRAISERINGYTLETAKEITDRIWEGLHAKF